jgi:hypothetical protein
MKNICTALKITTMGELGETIDRRVAKFADSRQYSLWSANFKCNTPANLRSINKKKPLGRKQEKQVSEAVHKPPDAHGTPILGCPLPKGWQHLNLKTNSEALISKAGKRAEPDAESSGSESEADHEIRIWKPIKNYILSATSSKSSNTNSSDSDRLSEGSDERSLHDVVEDGLSSEAPRSLKRHLANQSQGNTIS